MSAPDRQEVPITAVRVAGTPAKDEARKWYVPVEYTLDDGTTVAGRCGPTSTRKDGLAYVEGQDRKAKAGEVTATFHDGRFVGTRTTYRLYRP